MYSIYRDGLYLLQVQLGEPVRRRHEGAGKPSFDTGLWHLRRQLAGF